MTSEPQRHELDLGFTKTIKETTIIVKIKIKKIKKRKIKRKKRKKNPRTQTAGVSQTHNTQQTHSGAKTMRWLMKKSMAR